MAVQLAPASAPLAVFPSYIAQRSETVIMKEKIFSLSATDDAFRVQTIDGRDILKITADTLSLHAKKRVFDMAGNHLFTIVKEVFSFPKSYYAENPSGQKIFEVQGKFHLGTSKAVGHFTNAMNGEKVNLLMHGSFFNKQTTIKNEADDQIVAQIDRELLNARELLGGRHTYAVTVAPGVDISLIVAMVVCLDERRAEKEGHDGIL